MDMNDILSGAVRGDAADDLTVKIGEHEVLDIIRSMFANTAFETGKKLVFRKYALHLRVQFGTMEQNNNLYCVQLLFIIEHPYFDEEIVETSVGVGRTPDEATLNGLTGFCDGVLASVLETLDGADSSVMRAEIPDGSVHKFHVPENRRILHMGKGGEPVDLWEIVKDEIPHYIGKKRVYWIKLFATVNGTSPQCEARINNTVYPDLTDKLYQSVLCRESCKQFGSDKQFILLIQDADTYKPAPFTKQQVGELTWKVIERMKDIRTAADKDKIYTEIRAAVGDSTLGTELTCFIPEIYAEKVIQFRSNDCIDAAEREDKPLLHIRKSQLSSYGFITDAVEQYLRKMHPDGDDNMKIMGLSSQFGSLHQAITAGSLINDLVFAPLVYFIDETYQIR